LASIFALLKYQPAQRIFGLLREFSVKIPYVFQVHMVPRGGIEPPTP
jgi:hypothetical protein